MPVNIAKDCRAGRPSCHSVLANRLVESLIDKYGRYAHITVSLARGPSPSGATIHDNCCSTKILSSRLDLLYNQIFALLCWTGLHRMQIPRRRSC